MQVPEAAPAAHIANGALFVYNICVARGYRCGIPYGRRACDWLAGCRDRSVRGGPRTVTASPRVLSRGAYDTARGSGGAGTRGDFDARAGPSAGARRRSGPRISSDYYFIAAAVGP